MEDQRHDDPIVKLTKTDLEQIRSLAIKLHTDLSPVTLKLDESQFRTYCYVQATQAWLRTRNLLKVILD
jgi:hypothetical protein